MGIETVGGGLIRKTKGKIGWWLLPCDGETTTTRTKASLRGPDTALVWWDVDDHQSFTELGGWDLERWVWVGYWDAVTMRRECRLVVLLTGRGSGPFICFDNNDPQGAAGRVHGAFRSASNICHVAWPLVTDS